MRVSLFGTAVTYWWFPVYAGGDIALLYRTIKALIARGTEDRAFIDGHTAGFEELAVRARALEWDELEAGSITCSGLHESTETAERCRKSVHRMN